MPSTQTLTSGIGIPARSHKGRNSRSSGLRVRASFGSWRFSALAQPGAAGATATDDRLERGEVEHLAVVGVRQRVTHPFERRHRGVVEQRLLDARGRQALVPDALAGAPAVHA